jgi:hypothetical protein
VNVLRRAARFEADFATAGTPVPGVAWAWFGGGVAALLLGALALSQQWQALQQQRATGERDRATLARARASDPQAGAARRASGDDPRELALRAVAELRRPWAALLDQLEAARSSGAELGQFSVDARFEKVQLVVDARSLDDVLKYLQRLPGGGPVRAVRLVSHEWRDAPGGRRLQARLVADLGAFDPDRAGDKP